MRAIFSLLIIATTLTSLLIVKSEAIENNFSKLTTVDGFNGFKWGTPVSEVKKIYEELKCRDAAGFGNQACTITEEFVNVGNYKMTVQYAFRNKRLFLVALYIEDKVIADKIINEIIDKYGKPNIRAVKSKDDADKLITVWNLKESRITLTNKPDAYVSIELESISSPIGF